MLLVRSQQVILCKLGKGLSVRYFGMFGPRQHPESSEGREAVFAHVLGDLAIAPSCGIRCEPLLEWQMSAGREALFNDVQRGCSAFSRIGDEFEACPPFVGVPSTCVDPRAVWEPVPLYAEHDLPEAPRPSMVVESASNVVVSCETVLNISAEAGFIVHLSGDKQRGAASAILAAE